LLCGCHGKELRDKARPGNRRKQRTHILLKAWTNSFRSVLLT
jgi:hypothetical protein